VPRRGGRDSTLSVLSSDVARKRDIQQWHQACRAAGLTEAERFAASKALHTEKEAHLFQDLTYSDLVIWLREWKAHGN
jgi:hypothetical protein